MLERIKNVHGESNNNSPIIYVIQEIPGTKAGTPRINIMSASKYG